MLDHIKFRASRLNVTQIGQEIRKAYVRVQKYDTRRADFQETWRSQNAMRRDLLSSGE